MEESEPVVRIPVRKGGKVIAYALVDEQDAHLAQRRWGLDRDGYVRGSYGRNTSKHMQRFVMGLCKGDGKIVDHINGNKLDNRRRNLRLVTRMQNQQNRPRPQKNNKSGYRGACWHKADRRWVAQVRHNGKTWYVGLYATAHEAGEAAAAKRRELGFLEGAS